MGAAQFLMIAADPVYWSPATVIGTVATALSIISGIGAAIYAYRKAKPEATHVLVDAASDVVVIQKGYIKQQEELIEGVRRSLAVALRRIQELESHAEELQDLRAKIKEQASAIEELKAQNERLRGRLAAEVERSTELASRVQTIEQLQTSSE